MQPTYRELRQRLWPVAMIYADYPAALTGNDPSLIKDDYGFILISARDILVDLNQTAVIYRKKSRKKMIQQYYCGKKSFMPRSKKGREMPTIRAHSGAIYAAGHVSHGHVFGIDRSLTSW